MSVVLPAPAGKGPQGSSSEQPQASQAFRSAVHPPLKHACLSPSGALTTAAHERRELARACKEGDACSRETG